MHETRPHCSWPALPAAALRQPRRAPDHLVLHEACKEAAGDNGDANHNLREAGLWPQPEVHDKDLQTPNPHRTHSGD
jgi:hypothetical protein